MFRLMQIMPTCALTKIRRGESELDSEQFLRWKEFLENRYNLKQKGDVLLSSMEMVDEVSEKRQDMMGE
jgi:hypothetical protein